MLKNNLSQDEKKIPSLLQDDHHDLFVNFFEQYAKATGDEKEKLYAQLMAFRFEENKIYLNSSEIKSYLEYSHLSPYHLNRIFMHASLIPLDHWRQDFSLIFKAALSQINNSVNNEVFPESFKKQLEWLQDVYEKKFSTIKEAEDNQPNTYFPFLYFMKPTDICTAFASLSPSQLQTICRALAEDLLKILKTHQHTDAFFASTYKPEKASVVWENLPQWGQHIRELVQNYFPLPIYISAMLPKYLNGHWCDVIETIDDLKSFKRILFDPNDRICDFAKIIPSSEFLALCNKFNTDDKWPIMIKSIDTYSLVMNAYRRDDDQKKLIYFSIKNHLVDMVETALDFNHVICPLWFSERMDYYQNKKEKLPPIHDEEDFYYLIALLPSKERIEIYEKKKEVLFEKVKKGSMFSIIFERLAEENPFIYTEFRNFQNLMNPIGILSSTQNLNERQFEYAILGICWLDVFKKASDLKFVLDRYPKNLDNKSALLINRIRNILPQLIKTSDELEDLREYLPSDLYTDLAKAIAEKENPIKKSVNILVQDSKPESTVSGANQSIEENSSRPPNVAGIANAARLFFNNIIKTNLSGESQVIQGAKRR